MGFESAVGGPNSALEILIRPQGFQSVDQGLQTLPCGGGASGAPGILNPAPAVGVLPQTVGRTKESGSWPGRMESLSA